MVVSIPKSEFSPASWDHVSSGKVRELFVPNSEKAAEIKETFGQEVVLVVSTDRISAFDHILDSEIPNKGAILNQVTFFWLNKLKDICPNHLVSENGGVQILEPSLQKRSMICKKLEMFPVECVARGFLTGSAFEEYQKTGKFLDIELPAGLKDGDKLPEPIFTPAMKAAVGEHDENVTFERVASEIGEENAKELRRLTLELFSKAAEIAAEKGLTLVDTKFEFGIDPKTQKITLGDEVLTPDSSRYLDENGQSFDKQFVRNHLLHDSAWDRSGNNPPPPLPENIINQTRLRYFEVYEKLTGKEWEQ